MVILVAAGSMDRNSLWVIDYGRDRFGTMNIYLIQSLIRRLLGFLSSWTAYSDES